MKTLTIIAVLLFSGAAAALAHPGSGIVLDREGRVYFLDTGAGIWRIETPGSPVRVSSTRFHWMALDRSEHPAASALPTIPGGELERVRSLPGLLLSSDVPLAFTSDGSLWYPRRSGAEQVEIVRRTTAGVQTAVARVARPYLNGLAAAPGGALYFTEDAAVRKVDRDGRVTTVVEGVHLDRCASIPGVEPREGPMLRGLDVDAAGTVYVAASGCGSLLAIAPGGKVTTLLQLDAPWSPTAVALGGRDVYVLEYLHTASDNRIEWKPRVRKVAPDGTSAVVAVVER